MFSSWNVKMLTKACSAVTHCSRGDQEELVICWLQRSTYSVLLMRMGVAKLNAVCVQRARSVCPTPWRKSILGLPRCCVIIYMFKISRLFYAKRDAVLCWFIMPYWRLTRQRTTWVSCYCCLLCQYQQFLYHPVLQVLQRGNQPTAAVEPVLGSGLLQKKFSAWLLAVCEGGRRVGVSPAV